MQDESDEYHEDALDSFSTSTAHQEGLLSQSGSDEPSKSDLNLKYLVAAQISIVAVLAESLLLCHCLQSAYQVVEQGVQQHPHSPHLRHLASKIETAAASLAETQENRSLSPRQDSGNRNDNGAVRRENYPWNHYEPERLLELDQLNAMLCGVAPRLEVKAVSLPNLVDASTGDPDGTQLGIFAKEDLQPGEIVLNETSLLTANNRLQDALCDACNAELPDLGDNTDNAAVVCDDCEVVFCSQECHDLAQEAYHPALCDRDVEAIAKDALPEQAADSLYSLLLLRTLAMAETQACHPLSLPEVKYIWGDFNDVNINDICTQANGKPLFEAFPTTLPFSFEYNVKLPLHMLEKMDINPFTNPQYDVWVFNTLYAKFRGTASARLSGLGGRAARGPEVCAVHPMWCLANHSCDPNVSWQWGGSIAFHVREERARWHGKTGRVVMNKAGIRAGEEVLNHYCDLDLPVNERRAWARGALGGDCMCARCVWESQEL